MCVKIRPRTDVQWLFILMVFLKKLSVVIVRTKGARRGRSGKVIRASHVNGLASIHETSAWKVLGSRTHSASSDMRMPMRCCEIRTG